MNPGDVYRPPGDQQQSPRPLGARPQGYASSVPFPQSNTQPNMAYQDTYNNPPPAGQIPPSHSQPFAPQHTGRQSLGGYADPFNDPQTGGYNEPPGSRHYPSQPNLSSHTPAPYFNPLAQGPPYQQSFSPPQRARFDSNVSYQSSQAYPYGLSDNRLSSPPPLLPQHSSVSSNLGYPPQPNLGPQGGLYGNADDDMTDSAPLLSHASVDPRFGIPESASSMSMRPPNRYQLSDVGSGVRPQGQESDIGVVPGGWDSSFNTPQDEDDTNVHYGPVPTRVLRRNRTQKKVA